MKANHPSISMNRAISLVSPLPNPSHSRLKETMRSVIYWREVYIIPSGHKTNLVNLAKTRDTAKSMVLH